MTTLRLTLTTDGGWRPTDTLVVNVGDENAASLAASTPAGGTEQLRSPAVGADEARGFGDGAFGDEPFGLPDLGIGFGEGAFGVGGFGTDDLQDTALEVDVYPTDVCAVLPVGVSAHDENANASAVTEALVGLSAPPDEPAGLGVATTGSNNAARLSWTESPHV